MLKNGQQAVEIKAGKKVSKFSYYLTWVILVLLFWFISLLAVALFVVVLGLDETTNPERIGKSIGVVVFGLWMYLIDQARKLAKKLTST